MRPAIWGLIGLLALMPMATLADTMYLTDSLPRNSDGRDPEQLVIPDNSQAINSEVDSKIVDLQDESASHQGMQEQYRGSLPLSWIAAAIGVCLIAGFLLGMWWADYRSRQRHGGIRIY